EVGESVQVMGSVIADSKNFVHQVDGGVLRYTSREAGSVRVVLEGSEELEGRCFVEFPRHFGEVVSDSRPDFNVQVTPERKIDDVSQDGMRLESGGVEEVSYTVSAVREGYEDQDIFPDEDFSSG
ncbi:MAG: hypothetical protein ABEJ72_07530, partial [Candidatus Aenigmatarchaeota archaeon]